MGYSTNQIQHKPCNHDFVTWVFPRLALLHVLTTSFHWFRENNIDVVVKQEVRVDHLRKKGFYIFPRCFIFFQVGPGESHSIGLRFTPQQFPGKAEVFIFINDSEDKNEETFSINAVYT